MLDPASQFSGHTAVDESATKAPRLRFYMNFRTAGFVPVQTEVVTARVPCNMDLTSRPRQGPVLDRIRRRLVQH